MNKHEVMRLALDALESLWGQHPNGGVIADELPFKCVIRCQNAIFTLHEELAKPESKPVCYASQDELDMIEDFDATIYAHGGFDNAVALYKEDV